jgi:hypothetical protein
LWVLIVDVATQLLRQIQESEIISEVQNAIEDMLDLAFFGNPSSKNLIHGLRILSICQIVELIDFFNGFLDII